MLAFQLGPTYITRVHSDGMRRDPKWTKLKVRFGLVLKWTERLIRSEPVRPSERGTERETGTERERDYKEREREIMRERDYEKRERL